MHLVAPLGRGHPQISEARHPNSLNILSMINPAKLTMRSPLMRSEMGFPIHTLDQPMSPRCDSSVPRRNSLSKQRLLLNQCRDRIGQLRPHLPRDLGPPLIHRPTRHAEPETQLTDQGRKLIRLQYVLDREDQLSSLPDRDANFFVRAPLAWLPRTLRADSSAGACAANGDPQAAPSNA
jgi:hypothetical protein